MKIRDEDKLNKRRALAFYKEKLIVHIVKIYKEKEIFYNGRILKVDDDFFVIHDREDGAKVVFFFELKNPIVEFEEVEK